MRMALPRTAAVRESGDSLPLETSQVKEFVSYDDRNFYFPAVSYTNADTNASEVLDVIFKVHNGVESDNVELIRAHNDVLTVLSESGIMVPEPLPVKEGRAEKIGWIHLKRLRDESQTRKHAVRLLRFIDGVVIDQQAEEKPEMLHDLGQFLGKMDKTLMQLHTVPPVLKDRILLWDLQHVPALARFSECIPDAQNRALQQKVLARFDAFVVPRLGGLRRSVIQNDANEQNVLLDACRARVTGIIDFGDCLYTCLVFELAICIAYLMLGKTDPVATASHIYKGYVAQIPLTEVENAVLPCLVAARLVQSVTMSAFSHSKDPTNDYLLITAKTGWDALRLVTGMEEEIFLQRLKE